jgi:hypothetical protein
LIATTPDDIDRQAMGVAGDSRVFGIVLLADGLGGPEQRIQSTAEASFLNHGQAGALVFCGMWRRVISLASAI